MDFSKVSRIEIIDHSGLKEKFGRVYQIRWDDRVIITARLQDDNQTLKLFADRK